MKSYYSLIVTCITLSACQPSVTTAITSAALNNATLPTFCVSGETQTISEQSSLKPVAEGFVFLEGPVWIASLNSFLFSEMDFNGPQENGPGSVIHRLTLPATIELFIDNAGSNGLATDGLDILATTHDDQGLTRFSLPSKKRSEVIDNYQGKQFNSPNDLAISNKGHIYFSDPDWQLGKRANETGMTGVYHLDTNGTVTLVDGSLRKPNGVTMSSDQQFLYVGDADGEIGRYAINADGSTGQREEFAEVDGPDGMGMDCAGNLYATSHGAGQLHVISPQGLTLAIIDVAPQLTNIAFGGPEHKTILLTAGGKLFSIDSPIAGFPY
jgi:gluconolactonase